MIRPTTPERFRATAEALRVSLGPPETEREVKNLALVSSLGAESLVRFRRALYRVPPLSYDDGLRLEDLNRRLARLAKSEARLAEDAHEIEWRTLSADAHTLFADMAALFRRLVVPSTLLHRLLWRLLPNPFRRMTHAEAAHLTGFFLRCRMKSSVQFHSPDPRPAPHAPPPSI